MRSPKTTKSDNDSGMLFQRAPHSTLPSLEINKNVTIKRYNKLGTVQIAPVKAQKLTRDVIIVSYVEYQKNEKNFTVSRKIKRRALSDLRELLFYNEIK